MERLLSIDILKVFAIFGVVFIHASDLTNLVFVQEIFRFCVPIFIIFFAFFLDKHLQFVSSNKQYYLILKQRMLILFIPYLFFTILYFFLFNDISSVSFQSLITGYWSGYGWSGQYFFIILFQLIFVFPLLQRLSSVPFTILFFSNLLFFILIGYFMWNNTVVSMIADRFFIYWIFYATLGIIMQRKIEVIKTYSNKYLAILGIGMIPLEFFLLNKYSINHSPYVLPSVLLASTFLSIYSISINLNNNKIFTKIRNHLIYISKRTLGIFVLNPLIIFYIKPYIINYTQGIESMQLEFAIVTLLTFFILIFCLILIYILEKTKLKRLVLNS